MAAAAVTETWMDAAIVADSPGQDGIFTLKNNIKAAPKVFLGGQHGFTLARVMLNTAMYSGVDTWLVSALAPIGSPNLVKLAVTNLIGLFQCDRQRIPSIIFQSTLPFPNAFYVSLPDEYV